MIWYYCSFWWIIYTFHTLRYWREDGEGQELWFRAIAIVIAFLICPIFYPILILISLLKGER